MDQPISLILNERQRADLDLLLCQGYAPLTGFLNQHDYRSVLRKSRLASGALWPIPVTLDVTEAMAARLKNRAGLVLCRQDGLPIATMEIEDVYPVDLSEEAACVYATTDRRHPGVALLFERNFWYVGGTVQGTAEVPIARQVDFLPRYRTPVELQEKWRRIGRPVVAFHVRNPMHGAHVAVTRDAMAQTGGHLLLHPTTGPTVREDWQPAVRLRAALAIADTYPAHGDGLPSVTVASIPLPMRMAGPREALWHALIRANFGARYFIVGRAPADPGNPPDPTQATWYPPFAARELFHRYASELPIQPLFFPEYAWSMTHRRFLPVRKEAPASDVMPVSGSAIRRALREDAPLPDWCAPEAVLEILREASRERSRPGMVIFLTGLPGSGKSTLAGALANHLPLVDHRTVSLLDGDEMRRRLSSDLGFSEQDRRTHLDRVSYLATTVVRHGGIAIVAMVAPYQAARDAFRAEVEQQGVFVEIHVATPLATCVSRDPKGLYAKSQQGLLKQVTGMDAPFDPPRKPDLVIDTSRCAVSQALSRILEHLGSRGLVKDAMNRQQGG